MNSLPADVLVEILLRADDLSLNNLCSTSTILHQICQNEYFWQRRIATLSSMDFQHREASWKNFYRSLIKGGNINILSNTIIGSNNKDLIRGPGNAPPLYPHHYLFDDGRKYIKAVSNSLSTNQSLARLAIDGTLLISNLSTGDTREYTDVLDILSTDSMLLILKPGNLLLCWYYDDENEKSLSLDIKFGKFGTTENRFIPIISASGKLYIYNDRYIFLIPDVTGLGKIVDACTIHADLFFLTEYDKIYVIRDIDGDGSLEPVLITPSIAIDSTIIKLNSSLGRLYVLTRDGTMLYTKRFSTVDGPIPFKIFDGVKFVKILSTYIVAYALSTDFKLYVIRGKSINDLVLIDTDVIDFTVLTGSVTYIKKAY